MFSQSLLENVEVFKREGKRIALISCICMGVLAFLCQRLTHYRCGALYRLFSQRYFHNLLTNKRESTPHFSLYIYLTHLSELWMILDKHNYMSKYSPVVIHHSASGNNKITPNCRFVTEFSYIEGNEDVVWFSNKQYFEIFKKKRSKDYKNKLLAIVRLEYQDRRIRRRYKYNPILRLNNNQLGLTSESVRILFDDMPDISNEIIKVSMGNIWDTIMFYWDHPFHATRISFKIGIISLITGVISIFISVITL